MNERKSQFPAKVVSPFSGDYERNRKEQTESNKDVQSDNCFGINEIIRAMKLNSRLQNDRGIVEFEPMTLMNDPTFVESVEVKEAISKLKNILNKKVLNPKYSLAVQTFFNETLSKTGLLNEPATFFRRGSDTVALNINNIPDKIFLTMIFSNYFSYNEKTADFKKRERGLRVKLLKRFQELIGEGVFEADFSTIVWKINKVVVHLRDFLVQDKPEIHGQFTSNREIINISIPTDLEIESHVYTHEMIHAASGNMSFLIGNIKSEKIDLSGLVQKRGVITRKRTGLSYSDSFLTSRLFWLNEAITQDLTLLFLHNSRPEGRIYDDEIRFMEQLCEKGSKILSKKLFYDAYFEDTTGGKITDYSLCFKKLLASIDEAYGKKDFLLKLDDYVQEHGLTKTLEVLKDNPDKI